MSDQFRLIEVGLQQNMVKTPSGNRRVIVVSPCNRVGSPTANAQLGPAPKHGYRAIFMEKPTALA